MLESYITPILMSYISKYVKNIKPSDLQVSFWGGDAVLRNLELRLDVLEQALRYPLEIKSGHIRELVLHIPWNAILSKPVEAVVKDVEIVVKLKNVRNSSASRNALQKPIVVAARSTSDGAVKDSIGQNQPGYLQGYTNRILNNLTFHIQNLVVKVVEEECDMVMSFNVQSMKFYVADESWTASYVYTDYCRGEYVLNKVLEVVDMVMHLQVIESDRIQKEVPPEPFIKKCCFSCRMQSLYRGNKFAKSSFCVLFDSLVFSANEKQFSLFLHLLDWLLAMYYSRKKLKGRDDIPSSMKHEPAQPPHSSSGSSTDTHGISPPASETAVSSFEDILLSGSAGDTESEKLQPGGEGGSGWGSWVWSFVAAEEGMGEGRGEEDGGKGEAVTSGEKEGTLVAESSSIAIIIKSITVNLKVTHHGRVPVFSSPRSLSRTVLSVQFSGCSARVDSVPSTRLFAMSIGVMAMQAGACGFCSCTETLPSSWKTNSDVHEKVPVFSLGDVNSCDTELTLAGSLFDPEPTTVSSNQLPPLAELLLAPRPEFTAVSFTYEYYDVGPKHSIEVCEVRLELGEFDVLLSPDVIHRTTYFISAYTESLEACPLFSEGMVVIGDPKAETSFKINLAGGRAIVTSNTHYLASSPSEHAKPKPLKQLSHPNPSPSLPVLSLSLARSTISITSAMYNGNASLESPQRQQMRVVFSQLEVADFGDFTVSVLNRQLAELNKILSVPKFEVYLHSKTAGEGAVEEDSSYLQLDMEELSCVLSPEQVAKTGYVYLSWYSPTQLPGAKFDCPPVPQNLGHLHISMKEVTLTKSTTTKFTFFSVVLSSCSAVLLRDSMTGRLCHAVPVLCGPITTGKWNTTEAYSRESLQHRGSDTSHERLLEFFTATPDEGLSEDNYPTVQLSVGGLAVCLDAAVLEFVRHVPHQMLRTQPREEAGSDGKQTAGEPDNTMGPNTKTSMHSVDTATARTPTPGAPTGPPGPLNGDDVITKLKSYATKIDMKPMLIIIPAKPLNEGLTSSLLPEFPVLPALHEASPVASLMEALLISLPHFSLRSAKSHVLDEPVPKTSTLNTLPWDCTLHHACIIAVQSGRAGYIVDPLSVTVTLADQQGGTGVTVHADTIAVALSNEQGGLLSVCATSLLDALSPFLKSSSSEENEDSGIHSNYNPSLTPRHHHIPPTPSHLSSPAHSTITTATVTTLPAHTSLSTTSSASLYGFSALWLQAIITKITLTLYARLPKTSPQNHNHKSARTGRLNIQSETSSTASYVTPLTSPTGGVYTETAALDTSAPPNEEIQKSEDGSHHNLVTVDEKPPWNAEAETELAKLSLEIDGAAVTFDVQEKCTDLILKVASVDASLFRRDNKPVHLGASGTDKEMWSPYLSSEKILSSKGSALPEELSHILAHSSPAAVQLQTPSQVHSISSAFRNFVTLELSSPSRSPHKAAKLKLTVQSFEAVVWLPVVDVVSSVLSSMTLKRGEKMEREEMNIPQVATEVGSWPAIKASVECCRFVLPSSDYTNSILCNVGRIAMSTSLDYPTTDVRYIVSTSAFRRLAHLSSDKKQPPLPAYQMDVYSMSVWGIRREEEEDGSDQILLFVGSSDVRTIYTPALYWMPTDTGASHTRQRPAILACGHCAEVNFRTDLNLMLGPEQVGCISTILQSNVFSLSSTTPTQPQATPTQPQATPTQSSATLDPLPTPHAPQTVPFKGLVSGTTVGLTLVSNHGEEGMTGLDTSSESSEFVFSTLHGLEATVVPLLQIQLFNLLCSVCNSSGGCRYECSCFNMAVGYSNDAGLCSYSDLVDAGMTSSLLDYPLLETRQGQPLNSREIPPSVISVTWDISHSKTPVLSADISRPVKLTPTSQLIGKLAEFSDAILHATIKNHNVNMETECEQRGSNGEKPEMLALNLDPQQPSSQESISRTSHKRSRNETAKPDDHGNNTEFNTQVKVSTMQVLVEFQLSSRTLETSAVCERESFVSLEREMSSQARSVSVTEEGLVLVWDHLTLAYPNVVSTGSICPTSVTGDMHINGLQLLSIIDCTTSPIILPTQLNCFLLQHTPVSSLDLPYVTVNVSCGLLETIVSREVVDLAGRVFHAVNNIISSEEKKSDPQTNSTASSEESAREKEVVHFHDDLRAGDFTYTTDSEAVPGYSPQPGEIFFSLGSLDNVTSMSWHYREPRAITKLSILPVPFSFTSEEDAPVDIEVGCTLDYWDEDRGVFSVLKEFRLSETTPTEVLISCAIGSRKWRIAIVEVEWEDDEEGERFVSRADLIDEEGAPVPIASVLSPISLAGCTCVDSYFSPQLVPVSDLNLTCHGVQTTLVHSTPPDPGRFGQYEVTSLTNGPQELMRLYVQHLTCHLKQMRNGNTSLQIDGRPSLEFLDFLDLTWRPALHPTHLHAHLERKIDQIEPVKGGSAGENCDVCATLKCSPVVVRVSQGLLHTTSLAVHTWTMGREREEEEEREGEGERVAKRTPVILNHFILCNDTLQDLHFGQVSTDEVVVLKSQQCIGYSWRNHKKSPQALHMCLVTDGIWRWTRPFSIAEEGTQSIEVYIGRHTSFVNVCVSNMGGLQKQVTLTGSWKFSSTLPFPLHLSLVSTHDIDNNTTADATSEPNETFLLPPKSSLASLVVPASQLSGVRVKSPNSLAWSEVYPIHSATDDWNKPQLLTEMEYSSGQRVNLWYNINPMHTSKLGSIGSKITFSPLFAVRNHLPFDLTMVATETNAVGPAPLLLSECALKGEGEETILCGLHSDTWYHLSFRQSEDGGVSEPTVSLSTFLLVHLPFSATEEGQQHKWPYEDDSTHPAVSGGGVSSSIRVMLPLDDGSCCSLHAILERNPTNTVTLHLLPDVLLVNRCPVPIRVLTRLQEIRDEEEGDVMEVASVLNPNDVAILPQDKFSLITEWKGKTLSSQPVIIDPKKKRDQRMDSTNVILTEEESDNSFSVFSNLTLVRRYKGTMTVISVIPTYIFYNNTPYDLNVSTCLFYADAYELLVEDPLVVEFVTSLTAKPLLFWERRDSQGSGESVQALVLQTAGKENKIWSLPLSPDFVRHSFALPTSSELYVQAVLTMHENANTVYMVVAEDPSPRLLIQNLTQQNLEAVEEGTEGIHRCSQTIPPSQQVTYEPPTFAKQYPMVFDQEIAQAKLKDMQKSMALTSVKFRLSRGVENEDKEGGSATNLGEWSESFRLTSDSDRILSIPNGDSVLISTHRKGTTLYLTLLPTGQAVPLHPTGSSNFLESGKEDGVKIGMSVDLKLTQLVVCFDDEMTGDWKSIEEVLRVIADGAALQYSSLGRDGASLELSVESLHVNNMTESEAGDFAVTVIPREEHLRRVSLIDSDPTPLARLSVHYNPDCSNLIDNFRFNMRPLTLQLEDGLLNRLKSVFQCYGVPGVLSLCTTTETRSDEFCIVPDAVLLESERDVVPLAVTKLVIEPAAFYLNARISFRVLLSCNDSPFRFSRYELENVYSNWMEVSQTIASRYIMSTIAHIGWLLGSLELIGSPGTFIQNVGRGLRDLVTLPYQGLTRSPGWFLLGIGRGTKSFVHHLSSGALRSVTSMASSISCNMERLSLDPHHISYQTQQRQERPATHFTMGLVSGASSFGLSLMSAVAGIVEQPMQSYHQLEGPANPTVAAGSILKGVGKGLLGAVTKPVGGAMELVSQTGQGIMHSTGLARRLCHKPVELQSFTGSLTRANLQPSSTACAIKLGGDNLLLLSTPVRYVTKTGMRNPAILLLTPDRIYLLDSSSNTFQRNFSISEYSLEERVSGASNLEEVEIEIVAKTQRAETPKFHQVEYFLQLSREEAENESQVPVSPDHSLRDGDQPQEEETGVKLLIATHHAAQLLSFYKSLSQLSVHPHTVFCVHRTLKSESFLSAISN